MVATLYTIHIIVATILILVILLQQGKGSSLGAAFGGASQTVFGGATGRQSFLVKVTIALASLFIIMSMGLSFRASRVHKKGKALPAPVQQLPVVPATPGAPTPGAPSQTPDEQEPMPVK